MLKRILLSLVLAGSLAGTVAACNNGSSPSPSTLAAPSTEASAPALESPSSSEAAPSTEASSAPSAS